MVVCANGLGHFRRSTEIVRRLLGRRANVTAIVVCDEWQRVRMRTSPVLEALEETGRVRWMHGLTSPGVHWSLDPSVYSDGRLTNWVDGLSASGILNSADLVISDNLPQVLAVRPDAVLMGSFLWSYVLEEAYPEQPQVAEFIKIERQLLAKYRPMTLCVRGFALKDLVQRTEAIQVPWMCSNIPERPAAAHVVPGRVAVLGGASDAADDALERAARALIDVPGIQLTISGTLYSRFADDPRVLSFGYETSDFTACAAAVCRPALGTIHDCIAFGIPIVSVHDEGNMEMAHNGQAVQTQGLGMDLGARPTAARVRAELAAVLESHNRQRIVATMRRGEKNGYDVATAWLLEKLSSVCAANSSLKRASV